MRVAREHAARPTDAPVRRRQALGEESQQAQQAQQTAAVNTQRKQHAKRMIDRRGGKRSKVRAVVKGEG